MPAKIVINKTINNCIQDNCPYCETSQLDSGYHVEMCTADTSETYTFVPDKGIRPTCPFKIKDVDTHAYSCIKHYR